MSVPQAVRVIPAPFNLQRLLIRTWYLWAMLVIALGAGLHWWRFRAFTDQGYAPTQPIPFSHALHAGQYGIDCQYCHFNAYHGKHAGAPPVSICLGCHHPDQGAAAQDRPNIQLLVQMTDSAGFGYGSEQGLDGQAAGISKEGGVVHWNRVHLLPDHAYFSHEWHVKAGVACQTCHGPIETMEVVRQQAPLTMGWCMDCHRSDTYVGAGRYEGQGDDAFRVGIADYSVLRQRVRPDGNVEFVPRPTAANGHGGHDDHGHDGHAHEDTHAGDHPAEPGVASNHLRGIFDDAAGVDAQVREHRYFTDAQAEFLRGMFERHPDLPRWRVPDLPEVHRAFFGTDEKAWQTYQNASTQCSTCHH